MKAIELFDKTISRSEEMLSAHEDAFKRGRPSPGGVSDDLFRAIIVFSVSAFDAYLHKRIIEVASGIISTKNRIPEKCLAPILSNFQKKDGGDKTTAIAREVLQIAIGKKPAERVRHFLEKGISERTFQKTKDVTSAAQMMGIEDIWEKINTNISVAKNGPKKKGRKPDYAVFLNKFVERRDMIVHESDTYSSKKHHGNLRKITRTEVREGLKNLKKIVHTIEKISLNEK